MRIQVKGPARYGSPRVRAARRSSRRRQFYRNYHSTICQSKCLRRKPRRTPRPERLRFENTRRIHSRTSCADASPTATALWFSSPPQSAQPSVRIQVPGAVHERPGRHRGLLPAVAALVGAALPLGPNRVSAAAARANEAVRPATPKEILRAVIVVREHALELIGGQRVRKSGLIRHAPFTA